MLKILAFSSPPYSRLLLLPLLPACVQLQCSLWVQESESACLEGSQRR